MTLVVLTNEDQKKELIEQGVNSSTEIIWLDNVKDFLHYPDAMGYMDLLFEPDDERIKTLKQLNKPVIVSSVIDTLSDLPGHFVRINGWSTFLKRSVTEAAITDARNKANAEQILSVFNKTISWTPDISGFIAARIISMVINEAYFALDEKVSTREEIDTAMKLGTNYPYGPFEWGRMIGLKNIVNLLKVLEKENSRYTPAVLLKQEATS